MKEAILYFANLNPWCTFFTITTFIYGIIACAKSTLDAEYAKAVIIAILFAGLLGAFQFIGVRELGTWVDANALIYFIILCCIDGVWAGIRKYNRPDLVAAEDGD